MAVKSLFLLGVILAIFLLLCQETAHARDLTVANDVKANVEPAIGPDGLKDKKTFGIVFGGVGYGRSFLPGFGGYRGGYGVPGYGYGYGPYGPGLGFGGGFRGPFGVPRF